MLAAKKEVNNMLLRKKYVAKLYNPVFVGTSLIILISMFFLWLPLSGYSRVVPDEIWLTTDAYDKIASYWFNTFGFYRAIGILLLPFMLKFLVYLPAKVYVIALLAIANILIFSILSIRCLKLDIAWLPWVVAPCLLTPLWLRGGTCAPCVANEMLGGIVASTLLIIAIKKQYRALTEWIIVCSFILLAFMTYESHLPYALLFLLVSGRFRATSIICPVVLLLGAKVALSKSGSILFDPKIQNFETKAISWQNYINYSLVKMRQIADFLSFSLSDLLIYKVELLCIVSIVPVVFLSVDRNRNMKTANKLRGVCLFVLSFSVPIAQLFLTHNLENGGITWILLANASIGVILSIVWIGGHRSAVHIGILLAFLWIGTASMVQIGKLSTDIKEGNTNAVRGTVLERFASGFVAKE